MALDFPTNTNRCFQAKRAIVCYQGFTASSEFFVTAHKLE